MTISTKIQASIRSVLTMAAATAFIGVASVASAADLETRSPFTIPPQSLSAALLKFSEQADIQVMTASVDIADRASPGASGEKTAREALESLLEGTGLRYRKVSEDAVAIEPVGALVAPVSAASQPTNIRLAQADSNGERRDSGASTTATAVEDQSLGLEEVIVTARKSAERLIDVPLAITAFTADEISRAGIESMDDVAMATPGLNFISVLGEGLPTPVIRGVAPNNISAESSASIFVDGVYISGREGLNFSQLDLERIEVVKGPQSAIYGRNSFSGAINFITASPTDVWTNRLEATVGTDDKYVGKMVLSGPLIEGKLGLRLAYAHDESGGTYDNLQRGGGDVGGHRMDSVQARLVYTPTDALTVDLTGYYSDDHFDPAAVYTFLPNCEDANVLTGAAGVRFRQYCGAAPEKSGDGLSVNTVATGQDREVKRLAGVVTWESAAGTLTSVTSHSDVEFTGTTDYLGDRGNEGMALLYTTTANTTAVFRTGQVVGNPRGNFTREFSQELRFATSADQRARAVVGTYFFDTERETARQNFYNTEPLPADFRAFVLGAGFAGSFVNVPNPAPQRLETTRSIAGFGALEGDITNALTLRGEARYSSANKGFINYTDSNPLTRSRERAWDELTWRGSLTYDVREDQMIYASVARGEKSGDFSAGTDRLAPGSPVYILPYDGERLYAYEIGSKGLYLDSRLALDAAASYYDWQDIVLYQALTSAPGLPPFVTPEIPFYTNSGDVHIYGIEVSSQYRITRNLTASLSASWTDAEIVDDANSVRVLYRGFPSLAPDGNVGGNTAQRQSELQGAFSLSYLRPIFGDLSLLVRGDVNYKGKQFIDETSMAWIEPRTVVNARIGVMGEKYSVELWAQNLLNDRTPNSVIGQTFIGNTEMQQDGSYRVDGLNTLNARRFDATLNPLRQVGVTLKYYF